MTSRLERERVCAPKFGSLPAYIYIFLCVHTYISLKVYCLFVGAFANIHSIPAVPFFLQFFSRPLFFRWIKIHKERAPRIPASSSYLYSLASWWESIFCRWRQSVLGFVVVFFFSPSWSIWFSVTDRLSTHTHTAKGISIWSYPSAILLSHPPLLVLKSFLFFSCSNGFVNDLTKPITTIDSSMLIYLLIIAVRDSLRRPVS